MKHAAPTDVEGLPVLAELGENQFGDDPAVAYRVAHAQPGPGIFRMPNNDGLVATSYETLAALMIHPVLGAQNRSLRQSGAGGFGALAKLDSNSPFFMDEPLHTPMAAAVYQPMSPARQTMLVEQITEIAHRAMDNLLQRQRGDLVANYARVIAEVFWTRFLGLSAKQTSVLRDCSATVVPMLQFSCTQAEIDAANEGAKVLSQCLNEHYQTLSSCPGETLLHALTPAIDGCRLPNAPTDAAAVAAAMTFDAIDSAAAATANVLFTCLSHPDEWALLRQDPHLVPSAWREAMRVEPSVLGLQRSPRQPIVYSDIRIPADVNVLMLWAAGNRDPRQFDNPDVFNIRRPQNKLLSFGGGSRICKGRHLAMLQGQIALTVLLQRTQSIELLLTTPEWSRPGMLRAIQSIPVRLG